MITCERGALVNPKYGNLLREKKNAGLQAGVFV
jgi:hypothetical protein